MTALKKQCINQRSNLPHNEFLLVYDRISYIVDFPAIGNNNNYWIRQGIYLSAAISNDS